MNMGGMAAAERTPQQRNKGLLKEKLELERVKTKDGKARMTLKPIDDQLTFDKGFYVFIRALQLLRAHNQGVVLVGLGGASGSGKTAFSEKVKDFMPGIAVISMDNYNDGSKVVDSNFDDPRLTDYDLLLSNLSDLQQGKPAEVPIYDFKQSCRVGYHTMAVPESRVVIIEGIYALSERLKPLLDLRVSITGGVHFDLVKRVIRDINRSGQGPEEIIQQITDTVFPMYKAFIEPDLKAAQLKIHNSFNPFTGFMNATYILKAPRPDSLQQQQVVAVLGADAVVKTESEMCDIHLLPPNEDPETCASWLRMRNRDGRYTLMFEEWVTEGNFIISPRIQFEVSVRVLGGLMALGYEVGTVMRRTSILMTSVSGDLTVKFDDVDQLGNFVQVQGKDRDKVAAVAQSLELSDYIPRSYIEQVQLSKLVQDFQTFTEDMKKRFSVNGSFLPDDIYGSSPFGSSFGAMRGLAPGSGSRAGSALSRAGGYGSRGGANMASGFLAGSSEFGSPGGDSLLSCSAPVRGSSPIAINHNRSKYASGASGAAPGSAGTGPGSTTGVGGGPATGDFGSAISPSSSVAAAAGSTIGPSSLISSEGNVSIPGSVDSISGAAAALAAAAAAVAAGGSTGAVGAPVAQRGPGSGVPPLGGAAQHGSSSSGGSSSKGNGLLGQQLRNSGRTGSNNSLHGLDPVVAAAGAASGAGAVGAGAADQLLRLSATGVDAAAAAGLTADAASAAALRRLQEQMEFVSEGFKRHSGMQIHLDALTHQYKHVNENMAALAAATKTLTECMQQLQQQQQQQQQQPQHLEQPEQQQVQRIAAPQAASGSGSIALWGARIQAWLQGSNEGSNAAVLAAGAAVGAAVTAGALLLLRPSS